MADHPFPLESLPADPLLAATMEDLRAALKLLATGWTFHYAAAYDLEPVKGEWRLRPPPRPDLSSAPSAHESLELELATAAAETALRHVGAFLDPTPCATIGLRVRVPLTAGEPRLEFAARSWHDLLGDTFPLRAMSRTLPVARAVLAAFATTPFFPAPDHTADVLQTTVRESTRSNSGLNYRGLSVKVRCGRREEREAAANALRQITFLGALRDGLAESSNYRIQGFEILPARCYDLVCDAQASVAADLARAGVLAPKTRQAHIDRIEGLKTPR